MNRLTVATLLFFLLALPALSQESDSVSTVVSSDTTSTVIISDTGRAVIISDSVFQFGEENFLYIDSLQLKPKKVKSPQKALMFALVLPGLGQAYNEKYWKIPIVWGALGGVGYVISNNTKEYKAAIYNYIEDPNENTERYVDGWRRNMELSYIVAIAVYGLQILDAYVDANLSSWDVNNNLSLGISPSLQPLMAPSSKTGFSTGLTCSLKIRGR